MNESTTSADASVEAPKLHVYDMKAKIYIGAKSGKDRPKDAKSSRHYFANPQIAIQENVTRTHRNYCFIAHTHTVVYLAAYAQPRHNNS